jgi:hypothetical protein
MNNIIETITITIASGLIGGFISFYFSEKTENYKFELLKKEQAAKVAELFALWIKYDGIEIEELPADEKTSYQEKLNRLTWELAMWIRDEKLVKQIMDRLSNNSKSDIKEIIMQVREVIQNKKNKQLKWKNIVNFKLRKCESEEIVPSPSAPPEE